jgi:hypothetical protein
MTTAKKPRYVKVTLAEPHTHRGIEHLAGTELEVRPHQAARLWERGKLKSKPDVPELKDGAKADG